MIRSARTLRSYLGVLAYCAITAALLGSGEKSAQAIPLTELVAGETPGEIIAGDKLFSDWILLSNAEGTTLSQIDVTPLDDPANNPGLRYTDTGDALTLDTLGEEFQISFQYTVTVLDPTQRIIGNSLELVDVASEGFALVQVGESVEDVAETMTLATKNVISQGEPLFEVLSDAANFLPQQSIVVTTVLTGIVEGAEDFARLTQFDQRFAQVSIAVPEPASFAFFLAGLAGLGFFNRFTPTRPRASRSGRSA